MRELSGQLLPGSGLHYLGVIVIDIRREQLVRLTDVPKLSCLPLRRKGKQLAVSTVFRWATRGLNGRVLESLKVGGQRCTSLEALGRFFARETFQSAISSQSQLPANSKAKSSHSVEAELDKLGI